ncbi:MAG: anthranilate phosphoribosyltransferase, partial [Sphaerochaeta sp.]|nr:anthranilate phosphoribosyltransferase [Sphaerochaeta sp.]
MIREAIKQLSQRQDLGYETARLVMDEIMEGKASDVQMSSFLTALSLKGETIEEITACAEGMRSHCKRLLHEMPVLEIVGTGGDHSNSFNISSTSSIVISSCQVPVAKHGNRAASSACGSADVFEALGVNIQVPEETSRRLLQEIGLCFLFAQNYHISMRYVAPVRRELGIRTVFNILGPLANPAGASMQLMGVFDRSLLRPLAQVMTNLGVDRGMVVHGQDGMDEITLTAPTSVCEVKDGIFSEYSLTPEQFGFNRCSKEDLLGCNAQENASISRSILDGSLT